MNKFVNQNKFLKPFQQRSDLALLFTFGISLIFLISIVGFTITTQYALAQNSLNVSSSSSSNNGDASGGSNTASVNIGSVPSTTENNLLAQSIHDTGKLVVIPSFSGVIISLPDETHHPDSDNLQINPQNGHYLPENLVIPSGTAVAFAHGDPNHVHTEIVTDSTGNKVWTTTTISHPGATDSKVLPPGTYTITDAKYPPMKGTITVEPNVKSNGNLVTGAIFAPTSSLDKIRSEFQSAGFQIASTFDFTSAVTKQKDLVGPTTLIVYSTSMNMDNAKTALLPILKSLTYK
ncbi:MAG: cupredoxin domain-containing protein [Candidatus Nitrosocosmicus sp.]